MGVSGKIFRFYPPKNYPQKDVRKWGKFKGVKRWKIKGVMRFHGGKGLNKINYQKDVR